MTAIHKKFKLNKFPFGQVLSLESLLNYWKEKAKSGDQFEMEFAKKIIKEADKVPELFKVSPGTSIIEKNYSLVTNMLSFIISPFQQEHGLCGVSLPNKFDYFFTTKKMDELFGNRAESLFTDFFDSMQGENHFGPALHTYGLILNEFYGAKMDFDIPIFTIKKFDEELKIDRYFDVIFDQRFIDITLKGKLKKLRDCLKFILQFSYVSFSPSHRYFFDT